MKKTTSFECLKFSDILYSIWCVQTCSINCFSLLYFMKTTYQNLCFKHCKERLLRKLIQAYLGIYAVLYNAVVKISKFHL